MAESLIWHQATASYEGDSSTRRQHISIPADAMQAARQLGVQRAETNIHFFAQIMAVDFWLHDSILLALPGVVVTAKPSV